MKTNGLRRAGAILLLGCVITMAVTGCGSKETEHKDTNVKAKPEASTEEGKDMPSKEESTDDGAFHGTYIVNAEYVKEHIDDENVLFIDARGWKSAVLGTIKGSIATTWQDLSTCQEGNAGDEGWGEIPGPEEFAKRLGSLGITKEKEIILFADTLGWGDDGRILWQLVAAGYDNVKMLDGGFDAAKAVGIETQLFAASASEGEASVDSIDNTHVITTEELQEHYQDYKILDVRTAEEYDGAILYNEAKGGHLPGAIHFPYLKIFKADGTLKSNADIVALCEEAGIKKEDKIVSYCTGGIRSAYMQLVLEMCGYENTWNYDQSFWRWAVVGDVE